MNTYAIIYLPTGRTVKTVQARTELGAKRKAGWHDWALHAAVLVD